MSVALQLAVLGLSVAALLGVIAAVRALGRRLGWSAEVQRKSVHVAIGLYALALPFLFTDRWPVVALILVALALMLWLRRPASRAAGLGAAIHSVERKSAGDIWLALAIGFVFLRAGDSYILYALPIAVVTLSDAAAALTGSAYGRRRFVVEDGVKSWEGVVAFFAVTWIVAMVMLLLLTDIPRVNVVVLSFAIAVFAATVEAVSWRGLDNLFVPVCVHFVLAGYLDAPPLAVAALGALVVAALPVVVLVTHLLKLSPHASRALVIAIFFFVGVGGLYGTILPMLVIAAHLAARARRPCRSAHGDLDFIATLCAVGLIWFCIGETIGPSAINLYNLSLAGVLAGYALLALAVRLRWIPLIHAAVFALFLGLVAVGPNYGRWVEGLPWLAATSIAIVLVAFAVRPDGFDRWRAPRLAALASLLPVTAYVAQTVIA